MTPPEKPGKPKRPASTALVSRLRTWFLTGLLVLAPSAVTIWILFRLLNWVDNLLGQFLRFAALDYHRIPGIGLLATVILLLMVGAVAASLGQGPLVRMWDRMLLRIPGIGIVYGSTKSLGEALLSPKDQPFRKVVLVQWPHPGIWRVGFLTGHVSPALKQSIGEDVSCVFVPHTPNPASGFVHYAPKKDLIELDWTVNEGLKVIVSGGVVQPGMEPTTAGNNDSA
jgi:uncharacterized membrane protein